MFPLGLFVKPIKPAKQIHIKLIEKFNQEFKIKNPKKNKNKTKKKLIKAPL